MNFMQSIRDLEDQAAESWEVGSLRDQIDALMQDNEAVRRELEQREDEIAKLRDRLDELKDECYTLRRQIPDLSRDPDPYGLHGIPLSHRLIAIGFPEF